VEKKQEQYKWIRLAGFAFFLPATLVAGPLAGYYLGEYLKNKLNLSDNAVTIFVLVGLLVSLLEVVRIIRVIIREQKKG